MGIGIEIFVIIICLLCGLFGKEILDKHMPYDIDLKVLYVIEVIILFFLIKAWCIWPDWIILNTFEYGSLLDVLIRYVAFIALPIGFAGIVTAIAYSSFHFFLTTLYNRFKRQNSRDGKIITFEEFLDDYSR